jgi:tRNA(fMet)-specific endonuclease VapC
VGLILDTSVLIAAERGRLRFGDLLAAHSGEQIFIASITASEILHGVERASPPERKTARSEIMERFLEHFEVIDLDLNVARRHAILWADLEKRGTMIGAHDLIIGATALAYDHRVATLNRSEFARIPELPLIELAPFTAPI